MTTNKILRWVVLVGVFAIPVAVPFIVTGSMFFPFITGKAFTFRIIVEIIFAAWLLLAMCDKAYRPRFSYILAAIGVFLAVLILADAFAPNSHKAFWSNYERMEGFVSLFHMALYFVVAGSTLISEKIWLNFFRANILTSIVLSSYGFFQLAGKITINQGGVRVDGTFGNAAYFGGYMLVMIFLALFLLARDNKSWWKWVYGVAIICDGVILYNTATRGALLGLIGGLLLSALLIIIFGKKNPLFRKIAATVVVLVLALSGTFYAFRGSSFVQNHGPLARLTSIDTGSADAQARFMVWGMAWQGFKEKPILGWGQEGFNFVFNKYYNPNMYEREQWFDRTHNIVFDWLIAAGILGFLSYFSLVALFFASLWGWPKKMKPVIDLSVIEKALLTGLVAGYVFQNFFVFDNVISYILFFSLLAFLHWHRSKTFGKLDKAESVSNPDIVKFYLPIALVVLVVIVWFVNVRSLRASLDLIKALQPQSSGLQKNLEYFETAISRNGLGNQEIREQLGQTTVSIINSGNSSISDDVKSKFVRVAIAELKKQVELAPNDARILLFLGNLNSVIGSSEDEIKYYGEALRNSPKKQVILLALASTYMRIGQYEKAFELAKRAYESSPQFSQLLRGYLTTAVYAKKDEEVKKILSDRPDDFNLRITLAAVYLQTGKKTLAVKTLREIIAKNPDFKDQGEYYIKEIEAGRNP